MRAYMHVRRWGVTGEGLDPLINRIARNLLIDRHRRVAPHLVSLDNAFEVSDPDDDPTEAVIRRQRSHEVRTAVGELPNRHRTAIMYSMKGLSPAEVAAQLGIGRNAADALLHRARRTLRERLRHIGEGTFGIGLWFRVKVRNAADRVGLNGPIEAVASSSVAGSMAAAAAIVAAIGVFGATPSGPAAAALEQTRASAAVVSVLDASAVSPEGDVASEAPAQHGLAVRGPGDLQGGAGTRRIHGNGSVPNPVNPDQKILGVAPDVFHREDGSSALEPVCSGDRNRCSINSPVTGGGNVKGGR